MFGFGSSAGGMLGAMQVKSATFPLSWGAHKLLKLLARDLQTMNYLSLKHLYVIVWSWRTFKFYDRKYV